MKRTISLAAVLAILVGGIAFAKSEDNSLTLPNCAKHTVVTTHDGKNTLTVTDPPPGSFSGDENTSVRSDGRKVTVKGQDPAVNCS